MNVQHQYYVMGLNPSYMKQEITTRTKKIPYTRYQNNRSLNPPKTMVRKAQFNSFSDNFRLINQSFVKQPSGSMVHPSLLYLQSRGTGERSQAVYQLIECLAKIKRNLSFNFFKHLDFYVRSKEQESRDEHLQKFYRGLLRLMKPTKVLERSLMKSFFFILRGKRALSLYLLKQTKQNNLSIAIPMNFNLDPPEGVIPLEKYHAFKKWKEYTVERKFHFIKSQLQRFSQQERLVRCRCLVSFALNNVRKAFIKMKCIEQSKTKHGVLKRFGIIMEAMLTRVKVIPRPNKRYPCIKWAFNQIKSSESYMKLRRQNKLFAVLQIFKTLNLPVKRDLIVLFDRCKRFKTKPIFPPVLQKLYLQRLAVAFDALKPVCLRPLERLIGALLTKQYRFGFIAIRFCRRQKPQSATLNIKSLVHFVDILSRKVQNQVGQCFDEIFLNLDTKPQFGDMIKNISIVNYSVSQRIREKIHQTNQIKLKLRLRSIITRKHLNNMQILRQRLDQWIEAITFPDDEYEEVINIAQNQQVQKDNIIQEIEYLESQNEHNQTYSDDSQKRFHDRDEDILSSQENLKMGHEYYTFLQEYVQDLRRQYEQQEEMLRQEKIQQELELEELRAQLKQLTNLGL